MENPEETEQSNTGLEEHGEINQTRWNVCTEDFNSPLSEELNNLHRSCKKQCRIIRETIDFIEDEKSKSDEI